MMRGILAIVLACSLAAAAGAVTPVTWTQSTEADFSAGKFDKTVVTSLGEVMLARQLETLAKPSEDLGIVSAIAVDARGRVFVAATPKATVYRLGGGKLVKLAELPGVLIRALVAEDDGLVAGTCGKDAGIYRIDSKGEVKKVWADKDVTSVWSVVPGPRGGWYAATAPEGKVYHVRANGKAEVIYDSEEKNILSLAGGKDGLLYAGTGENGLVVEIDPAAKRGRILYDAIEKEISSLVLDGNGVLYAATSDTTKATADGEVPAKAVKGKPDNGPKTKTKPAAAPAKETPPAGNAGDAKQPDPKKVKPKPEAATQPAKTSPPPSLSGKVVRPPTRRRTPAAAPSAKAKGNAVYRIDPSGAVRAVFRRPVTILAMVLHEGALTLGTGHGGQVFGVQLDDDRTAMLAKVDPRDVTAMAADGDGKLYIGTAGKAGVFALGSGLARKGTLISKVLDANQIARWGTVGVRAQVPTWCKVTVAVRSGNVAKADDNTWSAWSGETKATAGWAGVEAPAGRFAQYRLTFTGNGKATPVVEQVQLVFQVQNLPPLITAVKVTPSASAKSGQKSPTGRKPFRLVVIAATDPNGDKLRYAISFRRRGDKLWIKLADKHAKPLYAWDTLATVDGTYEVRVEASDALANPPASALTAARISRAVVVDNTPPRVAKLTVKAVDGGVKVSGSGSDAASRIRTMAYAVDSNDEWIPLPAADGICDSRDEDFVVTIDGLAAGAHRIAVRVIDEFGNTGYAAREVTVKK